MTPSKDMLKSCTSAMAWQGFFASTTDITHEVGIRFKYFSKTWYHNYRQAFQAGRFFDEETDPGPFLGRALVWKVQVEPHVDTKDKGPSAMFNSGYYKGGALYYPDLKLKIA